MYFGCFSGWVTNAAALQYYATRGSTIEHCDLQYFGMFIIIVVAAALVQLVQILLPPATCLEVSLCTICANTTTSILAFNPLGFLPGAAQKLFVFKVEVD